MNNYDFLKNIKLFVLDMDGTVYIDDRLLNGAKSFINYLMEHDKDFVFFTNNSSKSVELYMQKLDKLDIHVPMNKIMTSTDVMIRFLHQNYKNKEIFVIGNTSFIKSLRDESISVINHNASIDTVPEVVLVAFDTELDYNKLNLACHYIRNGAVFLATHPDINCPCEYGYMIDCGAICEAISLSTGVKPLYTGKPSSLTLEMIAKIKGYEYQEICFVGDRLYTDIACAVNHGAYATLVLSGETKKEMLDVSDIKPTAVFEDLGELLDFYIKE